MEVSGLMRGEDQVCGLQRSKDSRANEKRGIAYRDNYFCP